MFTMKRKIRVLLAALLCLMMAVPACAAPMLVQDNMNSDLRWVDGTNLLRTPGKDGYSLNSIDGTALTGAIYNNFSFSKGYITAAQVNTGTYNCFGVFDTNGKVLVPFEYGDIKMESSDWALGVVLEDATAESYDYSSWSDSDTFYNIVRVDVYHMPEGKKLAELPRANFVDCSAVYHSLNIQDRATGVITTYDENFNALGTTDSIYGGDYAQSDYSTFRENGQSGIKDAAGNVIMAPSFSSVYDFRYGYAEVSTGTHTGLVNTKGEVVVPAEYQRIKTTSYLPVDKEGSSSGYNAFGYFTVVNDENKVGFVNESGVLTCTPTYSKDIVECNGVSMTLTDLEGNLRLISADGVETTLTGYSKVYALYYAGGMYYRVTDAATDMYGVIDWHGEVVLPCEYNSVSVSGDGQYLLVNKDWEKCMIYQLTYPTATAAEAAAPAEEAPAAEAPAEEAPAAEAPAAEEAAPAEEAANSGKGSLADKAAGKLNGSADAATETAEEAAPAETTESAGSAGTTDKASVVGMLNSAITLLNTDAAGNGNSAASLLQNARSMLGEDKANVIALLDSAITLLNSDAAANGASVVALLNNAITLLQ